MGFPGSSEGKESAAVWKVEVASLGQEDPLENDMATILTWRIEWTEEPDELQLMGSKESDN